MEYRPEIDGLRAVAVIPVVLYHTHTPGFSGGYVGVDVFFVISGYLITSILLREIQAGDFSMVSFYERRARRILPPLVVMSAVTFPFAWAWMFPEQFSSYAQSLLAMNLFSANIFFWQETAYFETSADLKPLLHTWSLGIEEQFYFVFPPLVLLAWRLKSRGVLALVSVTTLASFVLSLGLTESAPSANFYLLPTRAWELGVGALIAVGFNPKLTRSRVLCDLAAALGLALILFAIATFDASTAFPGRNALFPVVGTALVVVFAVSGTVTAKILSYRPLVFIGLLSYSLYLWHQPILAFARIRTQGRLDGFDFALLIALSGFMAYLSWRYVEQPFRNRSLWTRKQIFSLALGALVVLGTAGLLGWQTDGFPGRLDPEVAAIAAVTEDRLTQFDVGCPVDTEESFEPSMVCVNGESSERAVLWGDSHAVALAPALADRLERENTSLVSLTTLGCTPVIGYEWQNKPFDCSEKVADMRQYLLEETGPGDLVIIHGHWTLLLNPGRFDNGEGGIESSPITDPILDHAPELHPSERDWVAEMTLLVNDTIGEIIEQGRRVVVVYPVPEAGWHVPDYLARERLYGRHVNDDLTVSYELVRDRSARAYSALDSLGSADNLARTYPKEILCNTTIPERCQLSNGGQPLYRDDDHLSNAGATLVADQIASTLIELGWV